MTRAERNLIMAIAAWIIACHPDDSDEFAFIQICLDAVLQGGGGTQ